MSCWPETYIISKVRFFVHCTNFLDRSNYLKEFNKFVIVEKPERVGILKRKNVLEKRRAKIEKNEDKSFEVFI